MPRGRSFWGFLLLIVGALLLLNNLGILPVRLNDLLWPLLIVLVGILIMARGLYGRQSAEAEELSISLEGASSGKLHLHHGAGRLRLGAGAGEGELLSGRFVGGVEVKQSRGTETLDVDLAVPEGRWLDLISGFGMDGGLEWIVRLQPSVPLEIELDMGAGEARLDLEDLRVRQLRLKTGASATDIRLPAKGGESKVLVEAGVASVDLHVPPNVAARIRTQGGLADFKVDRNRFPAVGGTYESPDYESAENRIDIDVRTGVGSVSVM